DAHGADPRRSAGNRRRLIDDRYPFAARHELDLGAPARLRSRPDLQHRDVLGEAERACGRRIRRVHVAVLPALARVRSREVRPITDYAPADLAYTERLECVRKRVPHGELAAEPIA